MFDRQAVTANNVANVNTPGFKAARHLAADQPGGGVRTSAVQRDASQGGLEATGRALDLAVSGRGYLAVDTPRGQRFTRFGQFGLDADGQLVDPAGNRLLPGLRVPPEAVAVGVDRDGTVSATMADGSRAELGTVSLYTFANPEGLQAVGEGLFAPSPASGPPVAGRPGADGCGELVAGFLETSNVDLAREMTDQLTTRAALAANLSAMRVQDRVLGETLDLMS
jgi:flagellar basal-body rod protein FlgG